MSRVIGLFALTFRDPVGRAGQGQRRAGLSDPGHDGRQDHPHEAAEPGHRPADQTSGGGQLSIAPRLQTIAVGVIVERSKGAQPVDRLLWRPVSVLAGAPATAPWTKLSDDGERATFFAGVVEIELYRTETPYYRDNLAIRRAGFGSRCARPKPSRPMTFATVTADPAEGESLTEAGNRPGRDRADAGGDPGARRGVRRRASCRAAVRQTQARSRRSGSAGAARARARR